MVGGSVADDSISDVEFFGGVVGRDADSFEDLFAGDDRVRALGRDVERGDGDSGFMGDGLGLAGSAGGVKTTSLRAVCPV
jgi:hypothetical protein